MEDSERAHKRKLLDDYDLVNEKKVKPEDCENVTFSSAIPTEAINSTPGACEENNASAVLESDIENKISSDTPHVQTVSVDPALLDHIERQVDKGVTGPLVALSRTMGRMECRLHQLEKNAAAKQEVNEAGDAV